MQPALKSLQMFSRGELVVKLNMWKYGSRNFSRLVTGTSSVRFAIEKATLHFIWLQVQAGLIWRKGIKAPKQLPVLATHATSAEVMGLKKDDLVLKKYSMLKNSRQ